MPKNKTSILRNIKSTSLILLVALLLSGFALFIASKQPEVMAQKGESGTTEGVLLCNGEDNSYRISIATYNNCTVAYNSSPTLSWNIVSVDGWVDVVDCELTGWYGYSVPGKSGSVSVGPLTSDTTYSVQCWSSRGDYSMVASLSIDVQDPSVTGSIDCNSGGSGVACTIPYNTAATINWSSVGAESCSVTDNPGTNEWSGTSGTQSTGALTVSTTYELACSPPPNGARIPIQSVTVNVEADTGYAFTCAPSTANLAQGSTVSFTLTVDLGGNLSAGVNFADPIFNPDGKGYTVPTNQWAAGLYQNGIQVSNISADVNTTIFDSYKITYQVEITTGIEGQKISRTCDVYVNVTSTPTGDITCNAQDSCSVPYNTTATIAWTSQNAETCVVISDQNSDSWSGLTGSETTSSLVVETTYTLECSPPADAARIPIESVVITVESDFAVSCTPVSQTVNAGSNTSFIVSSEAFNGFKETIQISESMLPYDADMPTVSYVPSNENVVPGSTTAIIGTTESTTPGIYTIVFSGSYTLGKDGYTTARDCEVVELTVIGVPPVPPEKVAVDNQEQCGAIDISWTRGSGTNPDGYRVYRYADVLGKGTWTQLGSDITYGDVQYTSDGINYSYRDNSPLEPGSNYYTVVAYNYGTQSDYDPDPTGIIPTACEADLSLSDIDILSVVGNISKTFSPSACSGQSETASLPNNGLFSQNDSIEFQMNICSSGELDVTSPVVSLALSNLIDLKITEVSPESCVIEQSETKSGGVQFVLDNLVDQGKGLPVACSVKFTARIENSTSGLIQSRFQAVADIVSDQVSRQIYSPPYLVGKPTGEPNRGEIAP